MVKMYNGETYIIPKEFEEEIRTDERAKTNDELSEVQQLLILYDVDTAEKKREIIDLLEQIKIKNNK